MNTVTAQVSWRAPLMYIRLVTYGWRLATLLVLLVLSLGISQVAIAQADPEREMISAAPGISADQWRQVRSGDTSANYRDSRHESNYSLINASGETWRILRNRWVSPFGLIAVLGMAGLITLFYFIVGSKALEAPRTGRKILRWSLLMRSLHWSMATLFIVLALTGMNLLYGKFIFRPLFGDAVWGTMIAASKVSHNYLGPLFAILLMIMLISVVKKNIPKKHDLEWLKQAGGLLKKGQHPPAGFSNAGEKGWFWLLATVGVALIVSGFVLDFPNWGQSRDTMQWANIIHAVCGLGLTAVSLGHIYIGTLGMEGSIEGMTTGYVDETWAKEHHNLWYEEVKDQAVPEDEIAAGNVEGSRSAASITRSS